MHKTVVSKAMRRTTAWGTALVMAGGLLLSGCTKLQSGDSSSYLIVDTLRAAPGDSTTFGDTLASDVITKGVIWEDNGQVTLRLALKDPGLPGSPTVPTPNNYVTVNRYSVRYISTDGGPVPAPFEGSVTATIGSSGATATVGFTLVRSQAKFDSPLVGLRNPSSAFVSTVAEVTFFGTDQAGHPVSVKGTISVIFADWADPA